MLFRFEELDEMRRGSQSLLDLIVVPAMIRGFSYESSLAAKSRGGHPFATSEAWQVFQGLKNTAHRGAVSLQRFYQFFTWPLCKSQYQWRREALYTAGREPGLKGMRAENRA